MGSPAAMATARTLGATIPRQHGSWSILAAGAAAGLAAGGVSAATPWVVAALLLGFFAQHSAGAFFRLPAGHDARRAMAAWTAVYAACFMAAGAVLLFYFELVHLLPLAAAEILLMAATSLLRGRRRDITVPGELLGIAGLALTLPAVQIAGTGALTVEGGGLAVLCFLFFSTSVFHVRYLVRRKRHITGPISERLAAGWPTLAWHALAMLGAWLLVSVTPLPMAVAAAMAPAMIRGLGAVAYRFRRPPSVKKIGLVELAATLAFLLLLISFGV